MGPVTKINICSFFVIVFFPRLLSSLKPPLLSMFWMSFLLIRWNAKPQHPASIQSSEGSPTMPFLEPYLYASIFYYRKKLTLQY
jgi:hypothetical protein